MKRLLLSGLFCCSLLFLTQCIMSSNAAGIDASLRVVRVTPAGDSVNDLGQVVFEFDRAMVPLGDMQRDAKEIPITFLPRVECEWRWLNATTLACHLSDENALSLATHYKVTVNKGLVALDKTSMRSAFYHEFTTQRPSVEYVSVEAWKSPMRPRLRLWTTQPVTQKSLETSLSIVSLDGKVKTQALHVEEVTDYDYGHKNWYVEPQMDLPAATDFTVQLAAGFESLSGPEKTTEKKDVFAFATFSDFAFIGMECTTNDEKTVRLSLSQTSDSLCDSLLPVNLLFSAPVARRDVLKRLQIVNDDTKKTQVFNEEIEFNESYMLSQNHQNNDVYRIELPSLKPAQRYRLDLKRTTNDGDLKDLFDRPLVHTVNATVMTDHLKPSFRLPYEYAILEMNADTDVAVRVANLNAWDFKFHGFNGAQELKEQTFHQVVPNVRDVAFSMPAGIRARLGNKSGVLFGQFSTEPYINRDNDAAYERQLFAEVTPYQIHAKIGHFSTLVWVTDLASGQIVDDAKVTLYQDSVVGLHAANKPLASAKTDKKGIAVLPGSEVLDPKLTLTYSYGLDQQRLFVRVDKAGHVAVLPIVYDFEVSAWRSSNGNVNDYSRTKGGHLVTWGTTAQGIYRLGDKIQYKIYVRNQDNETLVPAARKGYALKIVDPTGNTVHELSDVKLSEFGSIDGEWTVSKQGSVGWYQFELTSKADDNMNHQPMRVLVSDFTPAPFKVSQDLNGDLFQEGQNVEVTTFAKLHSGGAYSDASARVTATVSSTSFAPKTVVAKDFMFSSASNDETFKEVYQITSTLNKNGELKSQFKIPSLSIYYGELKVESSVQDDRGKSIAATSEAQYASVDRFVGLKQTEWESTTLKPAQFQYIVVDPKGNAVAGTSVSLTFEFQETTVARIKDVGTTYSTHVTTAWKKQGECQGVSGLSSSFCEFQAKSAGLYRIVGRIKDTQNKEQITQNTFWVSGKEAIYWNKNNENFLEIVPEKLTAVVGEKARFLVKNPYPHAKALITVERYGVIDSFVKTMDTSAEVIEIPIKENYLPGFYLSITIQSPRVAKALSPGNLDLGKPTFSMGYISVPVVDRYKEITVTTKVESEVYRPRDKIKVKVHAEPKIKTAKREPIELAIAVVDESVFDLLSGGDANYDPYRGLYQFEQLDVRNYSLLTRLIGRQKFETKGANPGGGGGVDIGTRSIFKYVSYWQPSLQTNAQGDAQFEFEAPDNLTGWRVLVMAVTKSDRAGLGTAQFKVNRPTEIRPAMPNQVVEGDAFSAKFTVMNRTKQKRQIKVTIQATGDVNTEVHAKEFSQTLQLESYERATVAMPVQASFLKMARDVTGGKIRFVIRAGDAIDTDGMTHELPIEKNRSILTAAFYGSTIENLVSQDIVFPKKIFTDVGSVDVGLSSSVISSVEGAFRYMRDYPYTCWEQRLSKGVMAANYLHLKPYLAETFVWASSNKIAQETLDAASNFQAPSGGMCYFGASDDHADPYLSAYTALAFTWLAQDGHLVPKAVETKLHAYLLNYLRRDASPEHYNESMTATVRATVLAALAPQGKINLTDLTRFQKQFGKMNVMGQSHFIQAALQTTGGEKIANDLLAKLLSQTTQTSGKFMFSESQGDFTRILSTPLRNNCAALSTLAFAAQKQGQDRIGDVPFKLVRTIIETRKGRDYFENTQENLFCMRALADYSRVYESVRPKMTVKVRLDKESFGTASLTKPSAQPVILTRPIQKSDPGRKTSIHIEREGQGRLYYTTSLTTAELNAGDKAVNAGMQLKREYSVLRNKKWVLLKAPMKISRGEIVRVDLFLTLPKSGNFVVVNDPIPGGLEPVNQNLATASSVDGGERAYEPSPGSSWFMYKSLMGYDSWSFYHRELRNDVARFYSDYLSKGTYHLFYTAQAVAEGTFTAMTPLAQEMYNPDVLGKDVSVSLTVLAQ